MEKLTFEQKNVLRLLFDNEGIWTEEEILEQENREDAIYRLVAEACALSYIETDKIIEDLKYLKLVNSAYEVTAQGRGVLNGSNERLEEQQIIYNNVVYNNTENNISMVMQEKTINKPFSNVGAEVDITGVSIENPNGSYKWISSAIGWVTNKLKKLLRLFKGIHIS